SEQTADPPGTDDLPRTRYHPRLMPPRRWFVRPASCNTVPENSSRDWRAPDPFDVRRFGGRASVPRSWRFQTRPTKCAVDAAPGSASTAGLKPFRLYVDLCYPILPGQFRW